MRTNQTIIGAVAALLLAGGSAAIAAASSGSNGLAPRYGAVATTAPITDDQQKALDAIIDDELIPVQDSKGVIRGYVRDSALTGRDERVNTKIRAGFREPNQGVDEEYDGLYEALRVLDPVPVVDSNGNTVGYWTQNFKAAEDFEAASAEAKETVALLLGE